MSDDRNTLAWPSIEQFPREVAYHVKQFLGDAVAAAIVVQRAHRGAGAMPMAMADANARRKLEKRYDLRAWLLNGAVTAGEKYDGTNVGVLRDGTLLGRRLVIENTANSYQKCDLTTLRSLDTAGVLDELVALGANGASVQRAALYGELCCNSLYTYVHEGVHKGWIAFGALVEFADASAAATWATSASTAGLVCDAEDSMVKVANSEAFGAVSRRHAVPVVVATAHASLAQCVASERQWMVSERGEGRILTVARGAGGAATYKWKISREPQPAATDALRALVEELAISPAAALLDEPIREMVVTLLAVATHVDSTSAAAAAAPASAKPKPVKAVAVDAAALQQAITSALTKFDAIETYLDSHGAAGVTGLVERLVLEVLGDAELPMPAEGAAGREAAVKEVGTAIKKYVGQSFGAWKKARAGGG